MNKVILTGRLVEANELKMTRNDRAYVQNVLAVKKDYKDANGEYGTNFIKVVFWGQTAKFINDYTNKGDLICVCGSWENRSYDRADGFKAYISECLVEKAEILSKANPNHGSNEKQQNNNDDPFSNYDIDSNIKSDDLPF